MAKHRLVFGRAVTLATCAVWSMLPYAEPDHTEAELALAEQFVEAFYSFHPKRLEPMLAHAGESQQEILFYQGWAEGGNYVVMERVPCARLREATIRCSITVQDDLVLALGIDFDVTDTFTISFDDGRIVAVDTSSNDPKRYHDARDWTRENRPDLVEPHCSGSGQVSADPHKCVQGMLQGYIEYAKLHELTPRRPSR